MLPLGAINISKRKKKKSFNEELKLRRGNLKKKKKNNNSKGIFSPNIFREKMSTNVIEF